MKYTKEYIEENKIYIKCITHKELCDVCSKFEITVPVPSPVIEKDPICVYKIKGVYPSWGFAEYYTREKNITAKDFLEDREETNAIMVDCTSCGTKRLSNVELCGCGSSSWEVIRDIEIKENSITLTGDEASKYKIQKKIEGFANKTENYYFFIQTELFEILTTNIRHEYTEDLCFPLIKEIGEKDLKFFFGIEETITKKEAIIANESFQHKGKDFICKGMHDGASSRVYFNDGEFVKNSWFYEDENEQVKIIKDK